MPTPASIDRTAANISTLVHEVFVDEVQPWFSHITPMAGLFSRVGPKGYQLIGEKLVIARDDTFRGGFISTDGYIPNPETVDPVNLEFTPVRCYISGAIDNFLEAIARRPGAFENFSERLTNQMFEAAELGVARHIHGGSSGKVCMVTSKTSDTVLVVEDGYGFDGVRPDLYLEPGMTLALHDATDSFATVLGAAKIASIARGTSATTATITFAADIDGAGTAAAGDALVFATSNTTTDAHFVTEYGRAPLGLLDIVDPADALTTYGGLTESSYQRINPVRRASTDFGHVELMQFFEEISSKSNSEVTASSHVLTMHPGAKIELAKELLPYQQQANLGRTLQGGWQTVKIGEFDILTDARHIPSVVYALCPEDMAVVDVGGDLALDRTTGSEFERMADYDGKSWYAKWYGNRFADRRNRLGALTGITVPNAERYSAYPG
jgi:hypothetical protein